MKTKSVDISYRDKENHADVFLGQLEVSVPESVNEALQLYGEEDFLDYASKAYIIKKQHEYREANRPDRLKVQSRIARFKALSEERQDELLKVSEDY